MSGAKEKAVLFLRNYGMDHASIEMDKAAGQFLKEMGKGLSLSESSSLPMLPTYLDPDQEVPRNKKVIALDAGGTNFRTATVYFDDEGRPVVENLKTYPMPGTAEELSASAFFSKIAGFISPVAESSSRIGFCFSYPMEMLKDHDGRLIRFTKEVKAKAVEGKKIGEGLRSVLTGGDKKIVLLNDTVAVLLAGKSASFTRAFDSFIGFILGTGLNGSYIEENRLVLKGGGRERSGSQIINIEAGNFGGAARGELDLVFDRATDSPGLSPFEKMISGGYLGQLIHTVILKGAEDGLFSFGFSGGLPVISAMETKDANDFLSAPNGPGLLSSVAAGGEGEDREVLYHLVSSLAERAAKFTAIAIAAIIQKTGKGKDPCFPVCVTIDGSTFYKFKAFKEMVNFYLKLYLKDQCGLYYDFLQVDNAPLIGAAIAGLIG